MQTLRTTLGLLLIAMLVLAVPGVGAGPVECTIVSGYHETGKTETSPGSGSFSRAELLIPGPNTDGEMGTYHIIIYADNIEECAEGLGQ